MSKAKGITTIYISTPVHYARFHQPVPPYLNREPVAEFKSGMVNLGSKYFVEHMELTEMGLWFKCNGELNMVPMANIIYVRTVV